MQMNFNGDSKRTRASAALGMLFKHGLPTKAGCSLICICIGILLFENVCIYMGISTFLQIPFQTTNMKEKGLEKAGFSSRIKLGLSCCF